MGDLPTTNCATELAQLKASKKIGQIGGFFPECDANGQYKPEQFYGSIGQSWCVNVVTGKEIEGTRIRYGAKRSADYCSRLGNLRKKYLGEEFGEAAPLSICWSEHDKAKK